MSRSIGDRHGKKIGICSDPIITAHELDLSNDLFFVMASDGVWDTMNNYQVASFVELWRDE